MYMLRWRKRSTQHKFTRTRHGFTCCDICALHNIKPWSHDSPSTFWGIILAYFWKNAYARNPSTPSALILIQSLPYLVFCFLPCVVSGWYSDIPWRPAPSLDCMTPSKLGRFLERQEQFGWFASGFSVARAIYPTTWISSRQLSELRESTSCSSTMLGVLFPWKDFREVEGEEGLWGQDVL